MELATPSNSIDLDLRLPSLGCIPGGILAWHWIDTLIFSCFVWSKGLWQLETTSGRFLAALKSTSHSFAAGECIFEICFTWFKWLARDYTLTFRALRRFLKMNGIVTVLKLL